MSGLLSYIHYPVWLRPEIIPGLAAPRWYGLMYLVAFVITYFLFMVQLREQAGLPKVPAAHRDAALDMLFWAIVGMLVGARAFGVTIYDPTGYYLQHPLQIILPFEAGGGRLHFTGIGGLSYHGGVLGASVAIVIYLGVKKLPALEWGDMLVTAIPLGYTFGRLGNFINGELYGRITRVPWGMIFPNANVPGDSFPANQPWVKDYAASVGLPVPATGLVNLPRHPSQLYEAFFEGLVLWLVLWFIVRKRRPFKGFSIALYMMGYGIIRFFIEYVRQPDKGLGPGGLGYPITLVRVADPSQFTWFNFTTGQILNALLIAAAAILMAVFSSRARKAAVVPEAQPHLTGRKLRKKLR